MTTRLLACACGAAGLLTACASPLDQPGHARSTEAKTSMVPERAPASSYRASESSNPPPELHADAGPADYVRSALYNSPDVEAAYQNWRAAVEKAPQAGALPDPRLRVGFFLNEVETRVGPQQGLIGVQQSFPWIGTLRDRKDAASRAAMAAWYRFEAARLAVTERVVGTLHDLAYLDASIGITEENLQLVSSFEEVVRARYRVGVGSHPELIRIQVELGQLEDRLAQLQAMRPAYVADLNAALNREAATPVPPLDTLPANVVSVEADKLAEMARDSNPALLALEQRVEEQRFLTGAAKKEGLPELTVGLDYFFVDDATDSSIPESGDDPILLSFGISLPIWRSKYDAGVREATARRLAISHERVGESNRIDAGISRAWFEHSDADRRVHLYERTLIPKAEESLRASLAAYRTGDVSFLDLLDTERTLLEFAIAAQRARSDRGKALARLNALVGQDVPTRPEDAGAQP